MVRAGTRSTSIAGRENQFWSGLKDAEVVASFVGHPFG
jgi:hypothetical protein